MTDEQVAADLQNITNVANERAKQKQIVLDRLGITADEAALLLG